MALGQGWRPNKCTFSHAGQIGPEMDLGIGLLVYMENQKKKNWSVHSQ